MVLKNKNILITGSYGFIGSNLKKKLNKNNKIINIGHKKSKQGKKNSLTIENLLKIKRKPDIIFNCIGSGTVSEAQKDKKSSNKNDFLTTKILVNYINKLQKKIILIFFSSAAVYGNHNSKLIPISTYGKNKLKSERYLINNLNKKNRIIILRYYSIFGSGLKKQLIWDACKKIKENKLIFFGTGNEKRSWVHINDAIDLAIYSCNKLRKRINILDCHSYNVYKNKDIIDRLIKFYGSNKKPFFNKKKDKFAPKNQIPYSHKLKKLGWKPKVKIDKGLKEYVKWFKKN